MTATWIVDLNHPTIAAVGSLPGDTAYRVVRKGALFHAEKGHEPLYGNRKDLFWSHFGSPCDTLEAAQLDAEDHAASAVAAAALNRETLDIRAARTFLRHTPWGATQTVTTYGHGIAFYSTASHGGFHVLEGYNEGMPAHLRNADGWYEEDCEAAKVVLAFPDRFTAREVRNAQETWDNWLSPEGRARHEAEMAKWQANVRART